MIRFFRTLAFAGFFLLAVALNGCGGGGAGPSTEGFSTTSVYITDAPISGYSQVLVTVLRAELHNTNTGTSVVLVDFSDVGGMTFDLTDLAGVLRLVNIVNIPAGTYNQIAVTLANSITLRDAQGNPVSARFAPSGETYLLVVNATIAIGESPTDILIFDLDLSQFEYDSLTGLVEAVLVPDDSGNEHQSYGRLDEVEGTISVVNPLNEQFTLNLEHSTVTITVRTDSGTVCEIDGNAPVQGSTCYQWLSAGRFVKVKGVLNLTDKVIDASRVESEGRLPGDPSAIAKVEGVIASVDASRGAFTVFVREAEGFLPIFNSEGTLTIRTSQATIWDDLGGLSNLVPQMGIEIYGDWDDAASELMAFKVDAQGQDENEPHLPGPPPTNCSRVPGKSLSDYSVPMMPAFEVEDITLVSVVSTGEDDTVTASDGQTYYLTRETKFEQEPSIHICLDDLSGLTGREIEIKYGLAPDGKRVAFKLEVK